MEPSVDPDFTIGLLKKLVAIESVNPSLVEGAPGEAEIASYIADTLNSMGVQVESHEPEPGRVSVVGRLAGVAPGPALMLNGHIDTVGVEGMDDPFSASIRDGKLYGRGSHDMKGSVAACIAALKALVDSGAQFPGEVLLAAVADEEHASIGTRDLVRRYKIDGAIVTEPTQLRLCLAHKGFVWIEIETVGRAAHGSRFEEGVDANMHMGRVLGRLDDLERKLQTGPAHPLVGPPSLHAAVVRGGTGLSTYAARCLLQVERRTVPGESGATVREEIDDVLRELSAQDPRFKAESRSLLLREPFEVSREARIVGCVERAARAVTGKSPEQVGETPWMDAAILAASGVETVVIGAAGAGAHSAEEWVDIDSVTTLAEILYHTALEYCARAEG